MLNCIVKKSELFGQFRFFSYLCIKKTKRLNDMGFSVNTDKKHYCGKYKGINVWQLGCMIGYNWYGTFYCTRRKNGRDYKVKDSECRSLDGVKKYIDNHLDELKDIENLRK